MKCTHNSLLKNYYESRIVAYTFYRFLCSLYVLFRRRCIIYELPIPRSVRDGIHHVFKYIKREYEKRLQNGVF